MREGWKKGKEKELLVAKIQGKFPLCEQFKHKNVASRISPGFESWFFIANFIYKSNTWQMNSMGWGRGWAKLGSKMWIKYK